MAENISIDKNQSDEEIYQSIMPQIKGLINPEEPLVSNLSNITALLKEAFTKISWVGFYLSKENKLYLGPFQGKVACTIIEIGKGVCGTAAAKQETLIVDNVDEFHGHITCDVDSKSEIVIPLVKNDKVIGVLDLDSYDYSSFNEIDQKYLEEISELILTRLVWEKIF